MAVKNAIRHYRKRVGLTQSDLAKKIAVSIDTIRRWESGIREPRASDITRLCIALNTTEAELLNGPAPNIVKFSIIWEVDKDMNYPEVKMNEFKIGHGDEDDFGAFRFSKDEPVEEIGRRFMNHLRAARAGREVYDEKIKELEV
jgi:transcriptional regulator with XRE-family HTH domain